MESPQRSLNMLGLRKSISDRIHRRRSGSSDQSAIQAAIQEESAEEPKVAMSATPHTEVPVNGAKMIKQVSTPVVSVHSVDEEPEVETTITKSTSHSSITSSSTSHVALNRVVEVTQSVQSHICGLEEYDNAFFESVDLPSYLEYVDDERLFKMPRRGSDWDRVLRAAQFFGIQLWSFGEKMGPSSVEVRNASITALAACRVLLEIGHRQAAALAPTFDAFYDLGIMLSHVSQIHDLYRAPASVKEVVADLYADIIELVGHVAVYYRRRISSLSDSRSATINFDAAFGSRMTHIWETQALINSRMWKLKLGNNGHSAKLDAVRAWLKPERSAKAAFYDRVGDGTKRAEDTCEWFKTHLVDFLRSKDRLLTITGSEGSGKTMLADWIQDRLQRPLNHAQHYTLAFTFHGDYPERCTALVFLQEVLSQLLQRNVGDVSLYEKLYDAYQRHSQRKLSDKDLESALWSALESGLKTLDGRHADLVLIVDGVDEIVGQKPADFVHSLRDLLKRFHVMKVITLSKAVSHLSDGSRHLALTPQLLFTDIRSYFRQSLSSLPNFVALDRAAQPKLLDELAHKAKTSFIWAYVVCRYLSHQPQMAQAKFLELSHSLPESFDGVMEKLLTTISLKDETTINMLGFMLVSRRPFTVPEMSHLLSINVGRREIGRAVNVEKHIREHVQDVIIIFKGRVFFKSRLVRAYMHKLMGHSLPSAKDINLKSTLVLLLYAKLILRGSYEPSFEPLSENTVVEFFGGNVLLAYAVENWLHHFRSSTLINDKKELKLTQDFRDVFPETCQFALLERSSWGSASTDVVERHHLALKVREGCFGEKHTSVFQSLITLGAFQYSISTTESARYYYRAVRIGREIFHGYNAAVVSCTAYFLQITESLKITTRTEIVTYREEMIIYMIQICKAKHGAHDDSVIAWYKVLSQLYVDIKEEHRATAICKELYEIYTARFGKKSSQARSVGEYLGGLNITLTQGGETERSMVEYEGFLLESTEELDVADEKRVSVLLKLAAFYETQKKYILAEKILVTLWRRFSQLTHGKASRETHLTMISIALEYSRFLKKLNRSAEASNILICVWAEYEHSSFEYEALALRLREIGVLLKGFGLLTISVSIFGKVWGWFKSQGKTVSPEAAQTSILIAQTVEEVMETTVTTKTTTIKTVEVTQTVMHEVFETHFERCKKTKADKAFFTSSLALISLYLKTKNWVELEVVTRRSLELSWQAVLTADVNIKLSEHFSTETITLAQRLALCYHRQNQFAKAEVIYLHIFHACLNSLKIDDAHTMVACNELVAFYEAYHRHEKIIEIYTALVDKCRKQLGASHKLTIQILYTLAGQSKMLGRRDAHTYYLEIVKSLNEGKKHCHPDAFEAAVYLVTYYNEEKAWKELQQICVVLWETWVQHPKTCKFTEEIVQLVYERYTYVLEFHAKVKISVLYKISVEYRDTVKIVFGVSAGLFVTAMLALAKVCERDEKHYHESITLYEEVLKIVTTTKTTTTVITQTTITSVKRRLTKMYYVVTTQSTTTPSAPTLERAIGLALEAYAELKIEFGCYHEKTLLKLRDTVVLYQKLNVKESRGKILAILQTSFADNLVATSSSVSVYRAAIQLASIYVEIGLVTEATRLVQQFRHLIIFGNSFDSEHSVKFDKTLTRSAFIFLVAFEQRLASQTVMHYSELMASIFYEMTIYEQYSQAIEAKARTELILEYGAKLRAYWIETKQDHYISVLDKRLFQIFKTAYGSYIRTQDEYTRLFYWALLAELGHDRAKVDFAGLSLRAGNAKVAALLQANDFKCAIEVARCVFDFANKQGFYNGPAHVYSAFQLAEYMAGINVNKPTDPKLLDSAQALSKEITNQVLVVFRAANIDFVRMRFQDLVGIVRLLGTQGLFQELENLLSALWHSREVQKTWDSARVLTIGRLLVHAYAANQNVDAAIELCDRMCYNLRRSRGTLDEVTVEMSEMLSALNTYTKDYGRAMDIHEDILREIAAACEEDKSKRRWRFRGRNDGHDHAKQEKDYDHQHVDQKKLAAMANTQLELLQRAHLRMGGWTKPEAEFQYLYDYLVERLGKGAIKVAAPNTWTKTAATQKDKGIDGLGMYVAPREWKLESTSLSPDAQNGIAGAKPTRGLDHVWLATQQWLVS